MGSRKFIDSLRLAIEGISYCIHTQRNMRIHLLISVIAVVCCAVLKISRLELILIIMAISMVFICEIINTAIERAVDTATLEYHPIAKIAKDVAAGAVLVASVNSVIVGYLVLGKYLWAALRSILE